MKNILKFTIYYCFNLHIDFIFTVLIFVLSWHFTGYAIGNYAFNSCVSLTSVKIGNSIIYIGEQVILFGTLKQWQRLLC